MATLYVTEQGAVVRKVDERLVVEYEKKVLADVPLIKLDKVVVFGRVQLTSSAIQVLLEKSIEVTFLTSGGQFLGRLQPAQGKNNLVRTDQYMAVFDPGKSAYLAGRFVWGKLKNMANLLMRGRREGVPVPDGGIEKLQRCISELEKEGLAVDTIRGIEGAGTAAYFGCFGALIRREFSFPGRVRRPPTDPVNSLLSYLYTILGHDVTAAVNIVGLDPYAGFLHRDRYGRVSLALDLQEEFRPVLADAVVLAAINKGVLGEKDFDKELGGMVFIKPEARRKFISLYEQKKLSEIRHPYFKYRVTYQRCLELQARLLAKYLQGEIDKYVPFIAK